MADIIRALMMGAPKPSLPCYNHQLINLVEDSSWLSSNSINYDKFLDMYERASKADPITLNIRTNGGSVSTFMAIARIVSRHPQKTVAIINRYARSGGSLMCLVCDEIMMTEDSIMGPINPYYLIPITSRHIKRAEEAINLSWTKVAFEYLSDMEKAYMEEFKKMLAKKYTDDEIGQIIETFFYKTDHNMGIYYDELPECVKKRVKLMSAEDLNDYLALCDA